MNLHQSVTLAAVLPMLMMVGTGCRRASASPALGSTNLANGIRVVSIHFPESTSVSIFTFAPLGLSGDEPRQAQWSHLVEHLVIRSTVTADSQQANAETLPDHMRLDFYGNAANWQEGLSHHRRWLEGVPFTEASLAAEIPRVTSECDFTARNFATHKFAVAAWSQGFRHGAKQVALKGDVTRAALTEVQRFRDERLAVSNHVTVCLVGGVEAEAAFAEVEQQLGRLSLPARLAPAAKAIWTDLDLTWDLEARHLLLTWRIPDFRQPGHAALMVAAQGLTMRLAMDQELKSQIGVAFAGADLATPEGDFFFVSASLRPGADFEAVRKAIVTQVESLASQEIPQAAMIGRQFAASLTEVPNPRALKAQAPAGMSEAMLEGNLGLQMGLYEHRYGSHKASLAKDLAAVTPKKLQEAARAHLTTEQAATCRLRPAGP